MRATVGQIIPAGTLMSEVAKMGVRLATDNTLFFPFHCFSEDQARWGYLDLDDSISDEAVAPGTLFSEFNPVTIKDIEVLEVW